MKLLLMSLMLGMLVPSTIIGQERKNAKSSTLSANEIVKQNYDHLKKFFLAQLKFDVEDDGKASLEKLRAEIKSMKERRLLLAKAPNPSEQEMREMAAYMIELNEEILGLRRLQRRIFQPGEISESAQKSIKEVTDLGVNEMKLFIGNFHLLYPKEKMEALNAEMIGEMRWSVLVEVKPDARSRHLKQVVYVQQQLEIMLSNATLLTLIDDFQLDKKYRQPTDKIASFLADSISGTVIEGGLIKLEIKMIEKHGFRVQFSEANRLLDGVIRNYSRRKLESIEEEKKKVINRLQKEIKFQQVKVADNLNRLKLVLERFNRKEGEKQFIGDDLAIQKVRGEYEKEQKILDQHMKVLADLKERKYYKPVIIHSAAHRTQ